jgi:hypothetical protein
MPCGNTDISSYTYANYYIDLLSTEGNSPDGVQRDDGAELKVHSFAFMSRTVRIREHQFPKFLRRRKLTLLVCSGQLTSASAYQTTRHHNPDHNLDLCDNFGGETGAGRRSVNSLLSRSPVMPTPHAFVYES